MDARLVRVGLLVTTVFAVYACPKTKNAEGPGGDNSMLTDAGPPDAGSVNIPDAAISDAAPISDAGGCGPNQVRDGLGACRTVCQSQMDCAADETCMAMVGLCTPNPMMTACDPNMCDPGFVCPNPDGGRHRDAGTDAHGCIPSRNYCVTDSSCSLTQRCENNVCVSRAGDIVETCGADAGCPLLMMCTFGVCTGCLADLQCSIGHPGARCIAGTCVNTGALGPAGMCLGLTCPMGERCNPGNGLCEATCAQNSDCGDGGKICAPVLNQCVTDYGCSADAGCANGLTCAGDGIGGLANGICVGCDMTTPCAPGLRCIVGACFPDIAATPCTGVMCPTNQSCDPQGGACYPSNGRCMADGDCRMGHHCNFLQLCSGCSVDGDCRPAQTCFAGTCLPAGP